MDILQWLQSIFSAVHKGIFLIKHLRNLILSNIGLVEKNHIDGLAQDCNNSIAKALEFMQSCTKPFLWY